MTLRELGKFLLWLPKKLLRSFGKVHQILIAVLDDDPSGGWFSGTFALLIGMLLGIIVYGVLMMLGAVPKSDPGIGAAVGAVAGFAYFVVVLLHRLYLTFLEEQNELFNKLRGDE